ncbi:MAG: hypothetical protein PHY72_00890 [Candidatus Pacebacteria bacterium]|nr:hypothetical protein [Candidatus Paceibacterota bacterium]
MTVLAIIILIAGVANITLGLLPLLKDPKQKLNQWFGFFCFVFASWVLSNFLLIVFPSPFWLKSTYAFGALSATTSTFWIWKICNKKITKIKFFIASTLSATMVILCYLKIIVPQISSNEFSQAYAGSYEYSGNQLFFTFYFACLLATFTYMIGSLINGYRHSVDEIHKKQIGYILIGVCLSLASISVGNIVFPLFNLYRFTPILDSPSSLFFIVFSMLAISRYRLFGIRVILTEILVITMGSFLMALPFLMESISFVILTSVIFALFCLFGFLLIRSAIKESNYKDILEKEVALRTEELKSAKNIAEDRAMEAEKARKIAEQRTEEIKKKKEELERFYKLTVGRELKMVELKKEIDKLKLKSVS